MILDLFAGPGGWDTGLALHLGLHDTVGIEWDGYACQTRVAAGHATIRADVADYPVEPFARAGVTGLIASPPCQAFSRAGKKEGHKDALLLFDHVELVRELGWVEPDLNQYADSRAALVLQPLRWTYALNPEWIALEQVVDILPFWKSVAGLLGVWGYQTWVGELNAADYGVAQTRKRAILMAHRTRTLNAPEPTHAERPVPTLLGDGLQPWVSMGAALGWGMTNRPTPTVTAGGTSGGGGAEPFHQGSRDRMAAERDRGHWVDPRAITVGFARRGDEKGPQTEDGYRERDLRTADQPAQTVTEKGRSWKVNTGCNWGPTGGAGQERGADEPAPTLTKKSGGQWWIQPADDPESPDLEPGDSGDPEQSHGTVLVPGSWADGRENGNRRKYDAESEPAPTLHFGHDSGGWRWEDDPEQKKEKRAPASHDNDDEAAEWVHERPSTTIVGSFRPDVVAAPGWREHDAPPRQYSEGSVHITEAEGAVLQSFPADYPWQGPKTRKWEQIGNAVPPRLAAHVVGALTGITPSF